MSKIQKRLGVVLSAALLGLAVVPAAHAQRTLSAASLTVDDGSGHTMVIQTPQPGDAGYPLTASYVWKIPVPPPGNPPAGFVFTGTGVGQTLIWDPATGVQGSWRPSSAVTLPTGVMHSTAGVVSSSAVALATADVSGVLPIARGGTNSGTALTGAKMILSNDGATAIVEGPAWNSGTSTMTGNITGSSGSTTGNATGLTAAGWASPGTIGSTAANTGAFTALTGTGTANINTAGAASTIIGTGTGPVAIGNATSTTAINGNPVNINTTTPTPTNVGTGGGGVSMGSGVTTTAISGNPVSINAFNGQSTGVGIGTGNTTIGNATGTTSVTGSAWSVSNTGVAQFSSANPNRLTGAGLNKYAQVYFLSGGAATEVIPNALCTASSVVVATVQTGASYVLQVLPAAGTFTVTFNAAPAGGDKISYIIVN